MFTYIPHDTIHNIYTLIHTFLEERSLFLVKLDPMACQTRPILPESRSVIEI